MEHTHLTRQQSNLFAEMYRLGMTWFGCDGDNYWAGKNRKERVVAKSCNELLNKLMSI